MARLTACLLVAGALPSVAFAYTVRLDASHCLPLSRTETAAVGADWPALAEYAERCAVAGPDGRVALTVDVVRLDRAYAAHFFNTHPDQKVPDPVLRRAAGQPVGRLPEGFPVDPPGALGVTFTDWRDGWPWRVDLVEAGQGAVSPHRLAPLRWSASAGEYR